MQLSNLRHYVEVMRLGSFAAVARDRAVAPSSISRAISSLEQELGIRLFQRSTRRLQPTEAGIVYFERIEPLVAEMERARDMASDVSEQARGMLRITAPMSFAQLALVPLLPEFMQAYPKVDIDLQMNNAIVDLLAERIDVAIRLGPLSDANYVARRLCPMQYRVCASPVYLERLGTPIFPREIESHDCLLFPMPDYHSRWKFKDQDGNIVDAQARGRCNISNGLSLKVCAVASMGIAIQPLWNVQSELADGTLVELFSDYEVTATDFDIYAWILYPSRNYLPLKTRVFVDFILKRFETDLTSNIN
ncbi:MAG: LysR substrate-binding domain-containing protein [Thiohalomonadales bacterium]